MPLAVDVFNVNPFDEAGTLIGLALAREMPETSFVFGPILHPLGVLQALEGMPADLRNLYAEAGGIDSAFGSTGFAFTLHVIGLKVPESKTLEAFVNELYARGHKIGIVYADEMGLGRWQAALGGLERDQRNLVQVKASFDELEQKASNDIGRQLFADARGILKTGRGTPLSQALLTAAKLFEPTTYMTFIHGLSSAFPDEFAETAERVRIMADKFRQQLRRTN